MTWEAPGVRYKFWNRVWQDTHAGADKLLTDPGVPSAKALALDRLMATEIHTGKSDLLNFISDDDVVIAQLDPTPAGTMTLRIGEAAATALMAITLQLNSANALGVAKASTIENTSNGVLSLTAADAVNITAGGTAAMTLTAVGGVTIANTGKFTSYSEADRSLVVLSAATSLTVTATDYSKRSYVVAGGTAAISVTITLPEAGAAGVGRSYRVSKINTGSTVKVKSAGGDVINGSLSSVVLGTDQRGAEFIAADGTNWYTF